MNAEGVYSIIEEECSKVYPALLEVITTRIRNELGEGVEVAPLRYGVPYSIRSGPKSIGPCRVDPSVCVLSMVLPLVDVEMKRIKT